MAGASVTGASAAEAGEIMAIVANNRHIVNFIILLIFTILSNIYIIHITLMEGKNIIDCLL
jgi:hypothetical protein